MRNSTEIRVWMIRNGHTIQSISKSLGYKSHTPVSLTISGKINFRKVLQFLQNSGCPEIHLDLPKKMVKIA